MQNTEVACARGWIFYMNLRGWTSPSSPTCYDLDFVSGAEKMLQSILPGHLQRLYLPQKTPEVDSQHVWVNLCSFSLAQSLALIQSLFTVPLWPCSIVDIKFSQQRMICCAVTILKPERGGASLKHVKGEWPPAAGAWIFEVSLLFFHRKIASYLWQGQSARAGHFIDDQASRG